LLRRCSRRAPRSSFSRSTARLQTRHGGALEAEEAGGLAITRAERASPAARGRGRAVTPALTMEGSAPRGEAVPPAPRLGHGFAELALPATRTAALAETLASASVSSSRHRGAA